MSLLAFQNLRFSLNDGPGPALAGQVQPRSVLEIKGPSGAGKSTLLRVLARLSPFEEGNITFRGKPSSTVAAPLWRRQVQYLHQQPVLVDGTVEDNLRLPWSLKGYQEVPRPEEDDLFSALERLSLDGSLLHRDSRLLSGGEKARVALARSFLAGPTVLLLDEPTASLDEESRKALLKALRQWLEIGADERGLVLVSHRDDRAYFDRGMTLELEPRRGGQS
ncbi:MAG: ATP-binding cassette domain-containing protein [Synergistaceae bacterium]|jgi:putative ABC transport system ATP-binding protein|nr:ATP-binding cassette domain-containing protein [Synergistaceae bacterium]